MDFPLLSSCSLVVTFPPEIKIGINDNFQTSVIAKDGFLDLATFSTHIPYSPTATPGTHNLVTVTNACANGDQTNLNSGSITFGNIVSPA